MADWYVSSAAYAGYTAFQISHAYVVGDLVTPITPGLKAKWVQRCTTAGTSAGSEPTWATTNNGTVSSGSAVFTNVTGQSTYFWTAAAGDIPTLLGAVGTARVAAGDRVFISSDHSETQTSTSTYGGTVTTAGFGVVLYLSVTRAGSTPPVAADLTSGAQVIVNFANGALLIDAKIESYHYGIIYSIISSNTFINFGSSSNDKSIYLNNCQVYLNTSNSLARVQFSGSTLIMNNSTMKFGNATQAINTSTLGSNELIWFNTASALLGTMPTSLFNVNTGCMPWVTCRGVDLSATTGTLVTNSTIPGKYLFESCKIASSVTRYSTASVSNTNEQVTLINCYNGSNIISEQYAPNGTITTEFTITLSGGATDDVGTYSHKMVSNANIDKFVYPLDGFWMDVNYGLGTSKTATVEIISSTTLQNDEIALYLEYEGTSGSSVASFADSFITTPLTPAANVTSSSATWNSSPATPVTQKLQVTFTTLQAGRLRGLVRLGKASATVYYNPQITVT